MQLKLAHSEDGDSAFNDMHELVVWNSFWVENCSYEAYLVSALNGMNASCGSTVVS